MSGRKLLYRLYHVLWKSIDLLLPPVCGGCGAAGNRWCPSCQRAVPPVPAPLCDVCGTSVPPGRTRCRDCLATLPFFTQLRSWSDYDFPVRNALHRLKYRRDMGLGEALTPQLSRFVGNELHWHVDALVPVPLGRGRQSERGYNQAGLISWPLSLALGIEYCPSAIRRTRETRSQVGLSRSERRDNVRDAFTARGHTLGNRSVLLVDDVATTGATLSSCAEALLAAGARDVLALTVARARRLQPAAPQA